MAEPLALQLTFHDPEARIGDFGFTGPLKPLIDALAPILGNTLHAHDDHRGRDLRVVRLGGLGRRGEGWSAGGFRRYDFQRQVPARRTMATDVG